MNQFDYNILLYLNHITQHSPILTKVFLQIYDNDMKTGLFVALLWWAWFDAGDIAHRHEIHEKVVAGILGSLVCIVVVRLMLVLLPFRPRPMTVPMYGLNFQMPAEGWVAWSSFPSDHAALFFLLTVCLFSVSRILGSIALADTIFLICLPRVVLGVHYPTDIVCGAFIGIAAGYLVLWKRVRVPISKPMLQWMNAHPPSFYASAFLVTFLFAQVFWPVTQIIIKLKRLVMVLIK